MAAGNLAGCYRQLKPHGLAESMISRGAVKAVKSGVYRRRRGGCAAAKHRRGGVHHRQLLAASCII